MAVYTASGAIVSIGSTTVRANVAAYESETWVAIGNVREIGEFGSQSNIIPYQVLGDGIMQKSKGTRDNGDMTLTCGYDGFDAGQEDLMDAEATNNAYNIKIELPDTADGNDTPTIYYFRAIVASDRHPSMENESIMEKVFMLGITSVITLDAPAVVA